MIGNAFDTLNAHEYFEWRAADDQLRGGRKNFLFHMVGMAGAK